jgi:hypothetical protein
MIDAWTAAAGRLRASDQMLAGVAIALADYAQAIGLRIDGTVGTTTSGEAGPGPVGQPPGADVPPDVQRLAGRLTPWQPGGDTVGYAYDAGGRRLEDERFVSGRIESAAQGLAGRYRLVRTFTDHIEGHVAARMREPGGPDHVVLVQNNEPCQYAAGCHRLLRDVLPVGKTITVYVKDQQGVRRYGVYEGNGKGVAP